MKKSLEICPPKVFGDRRPLVQPGTTKWSPVLSMSMCLVATEGLFFDMPQDARAAVEDVPLAVEVLSNTALGLYTVEFVVALAGRRNYRTYTVSADSFLPVDVPIGSGIGWISGETG